MGFRKNKIKQEIIQFSMHTGGRPTLKEGIHKVPFTHKGMQVPLGIGMLEFEETIQSH